MPYAPGLGIHLVRRAGVAGERHVHVARAVIGAVARDNEAPPLARRLARDAHRVLIRIGTAQREENETALETGEFEQPLGERLARNRPPVAGDKAELLGLRADCRDEPRMLVAQVAAFDQAAHVEQFAPTLEQEPRAAPADDGGRIPVGGHAPAVQYGIALGSHGGIVSTRCERRQRHAPQRVLKWATRTSAVFMELSMKPSVWLAGSLALVVIGAGAFIGSGAYNIAADDPHWPLTESVLATARDRSIEARISGIAVPDLDGEALIRAGAGNYDAMCAECHLEPGEGDSELSKGLYPAPPNLSRRGIDDPAEAYWVIKHGLKMTGMPAWGKSMDDDSIWGVVAFLRQLRGMPKSRYDELIGSSGGHHHHGSDAAPPIDAPALAQAAAATVDRFFAALSAGNINAAGAELDPDVIIMESGGAEHSAAEYLGGHARDDAEFLGNARQTLGRRTARASGDLAWVASESELQAQEDGKPLTIVGVESMVLRATEAGWKIVHIHWSSRTRKPQE